MAKKSTNQPSNQRKRKKKQSYTAGEWFMVILGLSLVLMFLGIIITSVLGE